MPHPDGCPTIEELHLRYDGPIPKHLREAANAGGFTKLAIQQASGRVRHAHKYLRTNRAIRRKCAENPEYQNELQMTANANDLEYAMRRLLYARAELRAAKLGMGAPEARATESVIDAVCRSSLIDERFQSAMRAMFPVRP